MTREEAIERFENVKANALAQKASGVSEYWQNEIDGTIEALDMAIEALSADVVSRDVYDKRTQADEEIIDSYRKEFQKAISADRPITSGYIADDKEVPPYTTTSAVSADRPTIEHDREWIIGCIKHDGFIKTDRFDKANQIILDTLADRQSGEWQQVEVIDDDEPSGVNTDASQCSVCGAIQQSHYWATHYYNYCPSCGARMTPYKGGDDE